MSETYSVVVDVGYSFSHVVPFVEETPVNHAIKRVNVGGKLLTNYLKVVLLTPHPKFDSIYSENFVSAH